MNDYYSMTLKEIQWFSEGNFLEIEKEEYRGMRNSSKISII